MTRRAVTLGCLSMLLRAALVVCGQEPGRVLSLDAGGYSANVPETARAQVTMGENLLKNAGFEKLDAKTREAEEWTWSFHVYSGVHDEQRKRELEQVLRALARREITAVGAGSGGRCAFVAHPVKMDEVRGKAALNFTSYYRQRVVLPELTGDTKFVFAVSTRGRAEAGVRESRARVSFECFDRPTYQRDQKVLKFFQEYLALGSEWQRNEAPFLAPKDTRSVQVSLHLDNCGEAWFDDAALHRTALDQGVVMRLMPGYFMDNLFCLSAGDPGILLFSFRNEREAKIVKPLAVVELPEGVDVLAIRDGLPIAEKVTVQHAIRYALDIKNLARAIQKESYSVQNGLSLVVRTTLPVSDRTLTGRYWFADGEYRTEPLEFSLKVLPAIRGQRPVGFETAAMFTNEVTSISDEKAMAALADFYERVGLNAVHTSPCALGQALGEKKITRYYQPYWLCNGYRLGAGKKPDSAAFRFADGTLSDDGICPTEVYARGPYFQEGVVNAILRKAIVADRSTEHIMPNWEPFMYKYKGCFCDRCRDEFVKHSNVPGEEVAKSWPKHIIRDHRDVWMRFRSWQHGRLVQTLEEETNRLGREVGIESHFIPEIAAEIVMEDTHRDESWAQFAAGDLLDKLPVLQPWGGYCSLNMFKPYAYSTGFHLKALAVAVGVPDFVDKRDKRLRLIQLVHSYQGENWVATPEGIMQDMLTHFIAGWQGAFAYVFPRGYDARYWAALAKANSLIARFEEFVRDGDRVNRHNIKRETPLPAPAEAWAKAMKGDRILHSWEFRKGQRRLFAVGNFWEKGECFFRLMPDALDDGARYVLWEPAEGRVFGNATGSVALTAADLKDGMLLHVPAARYAFFVLEPFVEGKTYGATVSPSDTRATLAARFSTIQQAHAIERKLAAAKPQDVDAADLSQWKSIRKGELSCKAITFEPTGKPAILLQSARQELTVEPSSGGRIVSWKVNGGQLVHLDKAFALMLDGFWWPADSARFITQPYDVVSLAETDQGIRLVQERKLGDEVESLRGLTLTKTLDIGQDQAAIRVSTKITNTTASDKEFSHRYHNTPGPLELRKGQRGWADMTNKGERVRFERIFALQMFRFGPAAEDPLVLKGFQMDKMLVISEPQIDLASEWLPVRVRLTLDAKQLLAVCFWDSGSMACATLEPIHRRVRLKPGESWESSAAWMAE